MKWEFFCQQTFKQQIEILPRFTILYGGYPKVVAFEFLWFVVGMMKGIEGNDCKENYTEEAYGGLPADNSISYSAELKMAYEPTNLLSKEALESISDGKPLTVGVQ